MYGADQVVPGRPCPPGRQGVTIRASPQVGLVLLLEITAGATETRESVGPNTVDRREPPERQDERVAHAGSRAVVEILHFLKSCIDCSVVQENAREFLTLDVVLAGETTETSEVVGNRSLLECGALP